MKLALMSKIQQYFLTPIWFSKKNFHRAKNLMLNAQNYKSFALDDIIINACKFLRHLKLTVSDKFLLLKLFHLLAIDK